MTDEEPGPEPQEEGDLYDELGGPEEAEAPPSKAQPEVPEPERADTPPVEGAEAAGGGSGSHRRPKRAKWPWVFLGLLLGLTLLIGWTKTVNTDSYCTTCHTTQAAADSAARSVHSEVSCMSCHRGIGVRGAVAYIPTFARELVDQLTPLSIASGTMDPAPCESCHTTIFTSPLLKDEHPRTGCEGCHGNTTHPTAADGVDAMASPHPSDWIGLHGREADRNLDTCATCHLFSDENGSGTCIACHFRAEYPHPKDWITAHGPAQIDAGPDACTLCHPTTFCASCHGAEVPHAEDWLEEHYRRGAEGYPTAPCLTCHVEADCNQCHARHEVHNQQGIYER